MTPVDWAGRLADPASLTRDGLYLLEGRLPLERLLSGTSGGAQRLVSVLATEAAARALDLEARLPGRVEVRTPAEMAALTGFNFHRGVLALVARPPMRSVEEIVSAGASWQDGGMLKGDGRAVFVVLEQLVDADNVGSCFRNARAFGAAAVFVDDRCADPLYRKAVRTSMGTVLEVPWTVAPVQQVITTLQARGVSTLALTPHAEAPVLPDAVNALEPSAPVALVVGNEGAGLSAATLARCAHRARIPMAPGADSLNVATALAVALYTLSQVGPRPG